MGGGKQLEVKLVSQVEPDHGPGGQRLALFRGHWEDRTMKDSMGGRCPGLQLETVFGRQHGQELLMDWEGRCGDESGFLAGVTGWMLVPLPTGEDQGKSGVLLWPCEVWDDCERSSRNISG